MDPIEIINEYYDPKSGSYDILITHSRLVSEKALKIAKGLKHLNPDIRFIEEASMLHDIGIFKTNAPRIGCYGKYPYIYHGYLGGKILEEKGFIRHARVCERHPGTGISKKAIMDHHLDLPIRDMIPLTLEEKIICFADKFYSKTSRPLSKEIPVNDIIKTLRSYGTDQVPMFQSWMKLFQFSQNGSN